MQKRLSHRHGTGKTALNAPKHLEDARKRMKTHEDKPDGRPSQPLFLIDQE
jgi:hypothetical protein